MVLAATELELEQLVIVFCYSLTIKIPASSEYERSTEKHTGLSFKRKYL